jgi:hypothetical protein
MIHTFTLEGNNLSPLVGFVPDERSKAFVIAYSVIGGILLLVALRDDESNLRGWLRMVKRNIRLGSSFQPMATPTSPRRLSNPNFNKDLSEPFLKP